MPDRLSNLRVVDPVLTNLVRGYRNNSFIGDNLFPIVQVPKERAIVPTFGKEAFKIYDTVRALRADSNEIKPEGLGTLTLKTEEHDLAYPVDYREEKESLFPAMQHAARTVADLMALKREFTQASLAQDVNNYSTDNKLTPTVTWDDHANATPLADIKKAMGVIREKIARLPNTLILSWDAYQELTECAEILERIKYSQKGVVTVDLLKSMLELPTGATFDIYIGQGVYTADGQSFTDIWKNSVILAYVSKASERTRSVYDPSFGYTFRRRTYPFADRYTKAGGKVVYVRNTDNYDVQIVGAEAGFLLYNVVA